MTFQPELSHKLSHAQVEFFKGIQSELNDTQRNYSYCIDHAMNYVPNNLFININLSPKALRALIAYIEHVTFELTCKHHYSLNEHEFAELINQFYTEVEYLTEPPANDVFTIDLYAVWNEYSDQSFERGLPELYREGLLEYVYEMGIRNDWIKTK